MRDIENDRNANKNTLVVKIGSAKSKKYHYFLLISSLVFALAYTLTNYHSSFQFIFLIAYIPLGKHFLKVIKTESPKDYDSELKIVALSTFAFAILFGLGLVIG